MGAVTTTGFKPSMTRFLRELAENNNRDWFNANKARYEELVLAPALAFIAAMAPHLREISPHFTAIPRRTGGSLMRVYRDTRFSADKRPYKTNVGIQFRHQLGKNVHAPGFYVHLEPGGHFLGVGMWRPEPEALAKIRRAIDERQQEWSRGLEARGFEGNFTLGGDSLKRAPKGYSEDHPLIVDLKRKDFIASRTLTQKQVQDPAFVDLAASSFTATRSFMRFLCEALDVPF